jgi:pilus assembly protein CpaC
LILQRETETRNKVPYLGDLPWIGSAFSRRRSEVAETELLIMLTPQMAAPIAACQLPITGPGTNTEPPSDHEFYADGHVEVPNYNPPPDTIGGMVDPRLLPPPYVPAPPTGGSMQSEPILPPAAAPVDSLSPTPVDVTKKTAKSDNPVTQTSGVRPADSNGGTTVGTINPFRTSRRRPQALEATRGASVKSNAGDDLRGSSRNGHSAETETTAVKPRRRLELTDSSFASPDAKTAE